MAEYYYESRTKTGDLIAELPGYSLQGEWFLNKADQIRFNLPLHHPRVKLANIEEAVHEIWFWREGIDEPLFAGPVWDLIPSSANKVIDVSCEGLESYFDFRRIDWDLAYTAEERGEVAWDLIRLTQLETDGDLAITKGTVQPSGTVGNVQFNATQGLLIGTEISNQAEQALGGFDWKIFSGDRTFHTWAPHRGSSEEIVKVLEYGENAPITSVTLQRNGKYIGNDIKMVGPEGSIPVQAVDTTSRAKYGLYQRTEEYNDARTQEEMVSRADYTLQLRKRPKIIPTMVVHNQKFDPFGPDAPKLGSVMHVIVDNGYIQYDGPLRYVGFQFSLSDQGKTSVNMYLNDLRELEGEEEG